MNTQQKLDILNSMKVLEWSAAARELEYVSVENTPENIQKLESIGVPADRISEYINEGEIDISIIGFEFGGADWFDTKLGGFVEDGGRIPEQGNGPIVWGQNEDGSVQLRDNLSRFWCACGKPAVAYDGHELPQYQFKCATHCQEQ